MKKYTKEILGASALIAAGALAMTSGQDPIKETQVLLPYGTFTVENGEIVGEVEGLAGQVVLDQVEDALTLARIQSRPVKIRPWMSSPGATVSDPGTFRVTTFEVELEDGRTLRLELQGAMEMLEGETLEEARERFARTKE